VLIHDKNQLLSHDHTLTYACSHSVVSHPFSDHDFPTKSKRHHFILFMRRIIVAITRTFRIVTSFGFAIASVAENARLNSLE
jgi:hypothetical protein